MGYVKSKIRSIRAYLAGFVYGFYNVEEMEDLEQRVYACEECDSDNDEFCSEHKEEIDSILQ
jgi:hypothetical protein